MNFEMQAVIVLTIVVLAGYYLGYWAATSKHKELKKAHDDAVAEAKRAAQEKRAA